MSSICPRECRGRACHISGYAGHNTSCTEKSVSDSEHALAASYLSSDHLSCTIFFSPSPQICEEEKTRTTLSRRLTKLLRHEAARRGLPVGPDGYVCVKNILALPEYRQLSMSDMLYIVKCDDKKRYSVRVDDLVASETQRELQIRNENVTNDLTNLLVEKVNPLSEVDCRPPGGNRACVRRFLSSSTVSNDEKHLHVITTNSTKKRLSSEAVCVEHRKGLRDKVCDGEGPDTAPVLHEQSGCLGTAADTCCFPSGAQTIETGTNSAVPRSDGSETESAFYSNHVTASCGKRARADVAVVVSNFAEEQNPVSLGLCGKRNFYSGYVGASQVSIRAVQGHSLSSVDSDKLLRRVSTLADLVDSVSVTTSLEEAPTARAPTHGSYSCSTHQLPTVTSLTGAGAPTEVAGAASRLEVCVVHGTYRNRWKSIRETGLCRMSRNHIHFTTRLPGEGQVISGMRSNAEIFIFLDVERVLDAGVPLYVAENGVVLSPGNEGGVLECKFFKKVVDRKTGKCLFSNDNEKYAAADEARPR